MNVRNIAGVALIAAVIAIASWLISVSPDYQSTLRRETLTRPTAIPCIWSQPWADPAFVLDGWSEPQPWWHQPDIKVLWSNARDAQVLFHLPANATELDLGIKYPAVAASVAVEVNGQHAGTLDRGAKGNHAPHLFRYRLSAAATDGMVDVRFLVPDASMHLNDGRYLGVLLEAIRVCPAGSSPHAG